MWCFQLCLLSDILAVKVSRLRFEEGQAVGGLFGTIGELKSQLFSTAENVGKLDP